MHSSPPLPLFDWTFMRSFVAVINEGNLQAAAVKLGTTQPTVGRHIAALEEQLGCKLFDRRARQLLPTATALNIVAHAREMEANAYAIDRTLRGACERNFTVVRISASQCTAYYLLPPVLQKLREKLPQLSIEVVPSNQFVNLQRREADIAIRMARPTEEMLVVRRLGEVGIGCYASRDYLQRRGTPMTPQDLLNHELIGYDTQKIIIQGLERLGVEANRSHFGIRSDDHMMVWESIRQGLGIGFTSHYVAKRDKQVINIMPEMPIEPMTAWITQHEDLRSNSRVRAVFDLLSEMLIERLERPDLNLAFDRNAASKLIK